MVPSFLTSSDLSIIITFQNFAYGYLVMAGRPMSAHINTLCKFGLEFGDFNLGQFVCVLKEVR